MINIVSYGEFQLVFIFVKTVIQTEFQIIKKYFDELNIDGFVFSNGFKCSDTHRFEKLINLSKNIFELNFYQDQNNWKQNLFPTEISKNDSDRVVDFSIYKNHYALLKKLIVLLGNHYKCFKYRRCLNSCTSEIMSMILKPKCESYDITTLRTSSESHICWEDHFHKNPICFRIVADFEADYEIEDCKAVCNKTTNNYKQNLAGSGFCILSELSVVLQSRYYKSPLGYENVHRFVDEKIKLENKMRF